MTELRDRLQTAVGDAYHIERELPGGGMSRLFLATEASLHRQVVIKLLPPELASEVSATRFRQEIEVAARLQHTNILPILTAGSKDNLLYYVMPFVPGESLRHRLIRDGKLPVGDAVGILREIADALAHAHAGGVIHRDIKPENILLLGSHAVLMDFGVARALAKSASGGRLTDTGLVVGTPGYMSPEQAAGEQHVDGRADVYALAVVGYEMLAGAPPFAGPTVRAVIAAHLTATPKLLTDLRPDTPAAVSSVIARALAKDPNARLQTAAEFRDALSAASRGGARGGMPNRVRLALVGAAVVVLAVVAVTVLSPRSKSALDPNLIAVAPFDVLEPKLALWREGLVDVLSRSLDGAGALRTVPPTITIHRWHGRADPDAASELGRGTGAGLVVFGTVASQGADSVRVAAAVAETKSGRVIAEVQQDDATDRLNRLVDSLTVALLRRIGGPAAGTIAHLGFVGTTSLPALKAFLQGEQAFRRTAWDSAIAAYRQAVQSDSSFALPWHRLEQAWGWSVILGDSVSGAYALKAAALNHGLAPRESLLIVADSLMEALFESPADTAWRAQHGRLFATLENGVRRFPEDPWLWYELADANFHFQRVGRDTREHTLELFDRAIALDSTMAPVYIHPVEIALALGRLQQARRYLSTYLALASTDISVDGFRLVEAVLRSDPGVGRAIDTSSAGALFTAWIALRNWPDSNETAVRISRALAESGPSASPLFNSPLFRKRLLSIALVTRGHLKEAHHMVPSLGDADGVLAPLGGVPRDSAALIYRAWLQHPQLAERPSEGQTGFNQTLFNALPWWASMGDAASLAAFARVMDSLARSSNASTKPWLLYGSGSARAYLALVRRDSADALRQFLALPDTVCPCGFDQIITAQLLAARGRYADAAARFEGHDPAEPAPLWRLERARVYENSGRRAEAVADFQYVADAWHRADAELQSYVEEAKVALKRLTGEPRR
jgi:serine/threonine-protein kinase